MKKFILVGVLGVLALGAFVVLLVLPTPRPPAAIQEIPASLAPQADAQDLINELNAQACARHDTAEARARCVQHREIEQQAGLGPLPGEPGFEDCSRGTLPARYCGDVGPNSLRIRVSGTPARDYPLVAD